MTYPCLSMQAYLEMKGLRTEEYWVWLGIFANCGLFLIYYILTMLALEYIEFHPKVNAKADEDEDETEVRSWLDCVVLYW